MLAANRCATMSNGFDAILKSDDSRVWTNERPECCGRGFEVAILTVTRTTSTGPRCRWVLGRRYLRQLQVATRALEAQAARPRASRCCPRATNPTSTEACRSAKIAADPTGADDRDPHSYRHRSERIDLDRVEGNHRLVANDAAL